MINCALSNCAINGNTIYNFTGAPAVAIRIAGSGNAIVGNVGDGTDTILQASGSGNVGYSETQDVNAGFSYT